jgi:thioredoxin reductase
MTDAADVDVLVVGAGPAGLTAAAELRRLGVERVLVTDREAEPGGVPRHSQHTGYGLRDRHQVMTGPAYARALTDAAVRAGVDVRPGSTVTSLHVGVAGTAPAAQSGPNRELPAAVLNADQSGPDRELPAAVLNADQSGCDDGRLAVVVTSARGVQTVHPAAVLLASGCRERPRSARLVPGDRPVGIMTTGELQQRVYLNGERLAGRALVVGAEHVAFSAAVTLAHAGAHVIALVTDLERHQSYAAFRAGAALRWRTPVWTSAVVTRIDGPGGRLAGVEIAGSTGGNPRYVPCELLVFTGDWIPDHALARSAGLAIDAGTRGPAVDTALATSADGVFAAGNLVHAAETADIAALSGRHAARQIATYLHGQRPPAPDRPPRVPLEVATPLQWISPNAVTPGCPPPLGRFILRTAEFHRPASLEVRQAGRLLARSRPRHLVPGRPVHLAADWLAAVDPAAGPIRVAVSS